MSTVFRNCLVKHGKNDDDATHKRNEKHARTSRRRRRELLSQFGAEIVSEAKPLQCFDETAAAERSASVLVVESERGQTVVDRISKLGHCVSLLSAGAAGHRVSHLVVIVVGFERARIDERREEADDVVRARIDQRRKVGELEVRVDVTGAVVVVVLVVVVRLVVERAEIGAHKIRFATPQPPRQMQNEKGSITRFQIELVSSSLERRDDKRRTQASHSHRW